MTEPRPDLRATDVIPKPLKSLVEKLGLGRDYFPTLWSLSRVRTDALDDAENEFSRPLEFLRGSCTLVATWIVSVSASQSQLLNGQVFTQAFGSLLPEWLLIYLAILTFSFISLHADMLVLRCLQETPRKRMGYRIRLRGLAYLTGLGLFWAIPAQFIVLLLVTAGLDVDAGGGIEQCLRVPVAVIQFGLAIKWFNLDDTKVRRLLTVLRWVAIYIPAGVAIAVLGTSVADSLLNGK